ncbi:MAG: glycosyltransferase family 2 protein [Flavobacterium sp.]
MNSPLVSIIIPTYNRAHLISETLDSVLAQTFENWECIIVDDGSTDNTNEVVEEYLKKDSRFQYHHRPANRPKGANACRNYGFELSKGEYINWFDSDDVMHHDKLLIQISSLENSNYNFSVCQTLVFENSIENVIGLRHGIIHSENPFVDYLMLKIIWMTPSALWKKGLLQTLDYLYDEELQAAQEWEFHCRVLNKFDEYNVVEEPLVYIRYHIQSISYNSDNKKRIWNYFMARYKLYKNESLIFDEQVSKYLQDYLLANFKGFIRLNYFKESFKAFNLYILKENKLKFRIKFYAIISIISYRVVKRGDKLLKKVKYIR